MKLFVLCIDALCSSDLSLMEKMPNFSRLFRNGSVVRQVEPIHPALTYPCHTTILTGRDVAGHGIYHNENFTRGGQLHQPWFTMKSSVRVPTLLDVAASAGMTTCSVSWPVSGGASYTYNLPMAVPLEYTGDHPEQFLCDTATPNLMKRYWKDLGGHLKGQERNLDRFTMVLAPTIIRDFGQPDVMLVKLCDLDTVRHTWGVYHEETKRQLQIHDEQLGVLLESVRHFGDFEDTNFVVLGDHGQTDVEDVFCLNVLFRSTGLLRVDATGKVASFDALCHSCGLSAFIELGDPGDYAMAAKVRDMLEAMKHDPAIRLRYVLDRNEMRAAYGLEGPFDFVIESERNIAFSETLEGDALWGSRISGNHKIGAATHGGSPDRAELTAFLASGPSVRAGIEIEHCSMLCLAPAMAAMLGLELPETDAQPLNAMLRWNCNEN